MKTKSTYLIIALFFAVIICKAQKNDIHRISKEQKVYEISVIWKELSYNFANMDNCPGLDLDSLYRAYIPIVQNTKNDWEYYKALLRFMAHFNNGHNYCNWPLYLASSLCYPMLWTVYKEGKVLIDNIGSHYSDKVSVGDEVLSINKMPALIYFEKHAVPYVFTSNIDTKLKLAVSHSVNRFALKNKHRKLKLEVKTSLGIEKITIPYDRLLQPEPKDTARQNKLHVLQKTVNKSGNLFVFDVQNDISYVNLTVCDSTFSDFFMQRYDTIRKLGNLIIDISNNFGGDSRAPWQVAQILINDDSVMINGTEKARINNSLYRAWAAIKKIYYKDEDVPEFHKIKYYPHIEGTAFEDVKMNEGHPYANAYPDSMRYKGKIYVILGNNTASAAEYFALLLTQNPNTVFLGEKTEGAMAQPLAVKLPSGITAFINSTKTYDFKENDISSGFIPDYEYDFSSFYKTDNAKEILRHFVKTLQTLPGKSSEKQRP
jgi:C-terminal processing protease CtpA/Prc